MLFLGQKGAVMFSCYSSWQHFSIAQTVLSLLFAVSLLEGETYMSNSVIQTQYTDSMTGLSPGRLWGWSEGIAEQDPEPIA